MSVESSFNAWRECRISLEQRACQALLGKTVKAKEGLRSYSGWASPAPGDSSLNQDGAWQAAGNRDQIGGATSSMGFKPCPIGVIRYETPRIPHPSRQGDTGCRLSDESPPVIPANAGIQAGFLDSGFRRNDQDMPRMIVIGRCAPTGHGALQEGRQDALRHRSEKPVGASKGLGLGRFGKGAGTVSLPVPGTWSI
jgi:hypothetical protein